MKWIELKQQAAAAAIRTIKWTHLVGIFSHIFFEVRYNHQLFKRVWVWGHTFSAIVLCRHYHITSYIRGWNNAHLCIFSGVLIRMDHIIKILYTNGSIHFMTWRVAVVVIELSSIVCMHCRKLVATDICMECTVHTPLYMHAICKTNMTNCSLTHTLTQTSRN